MSDNQIENIDVQVEKEEQDYTGTALAGFILAIISWVLGGVVGIILAIIALVLSAKSRKVKRMPYKVFNIIGLVLSIVSLSFNVVSVIISLIWSFIGGAIAFGSIILFVYVFLTGSKNFMESISGTAMALLPLMLM